MMANSIAKSNGRSEMSFNHFPSTMMAKPVEGVLKPQLIQRGLQLVQRDVVHAINVAGPLRCFRFHGQSNSVFWTIQKGA